MPAYWKGYLRLALVSVQVRLLNATTTADRITLNQIHRGCNTRLKFPPVCPVHGQIDRSEVAKGYEVADGQYVLIEPQELQRIKLRTERSIEISIFVDADAVDDKYFDTPYYVAPDGAAADSPYRIIREAIRKTKTVGIGRVVLSSREHPVLLRAEGPGLLMTTLRTAAEVRPSAEAFNHVGDAKVNPDHIQMAVTLIESMRGEFNPSLFHDHYQDALRKLVESKIEGRGPVAVHEEDLPANVDIVDALRQSLHLESKPKSGRRAASARPPGKKRRHP